jgi:hypothetical protein
MEAFDICVLLFTGLVAGIATGLAIRTKQIKNLQEEVYAGDETYMRLLDRYMELFSEHRDLKFGNKAKVETTKRSPGRPKGSTNKVKKDGRSTTRKYTRKSSK